MLSGQRQTGGLIDASKWDLPRVTARGGWGGKEFCAPTHWHPGKGQKGRGRNWGTIAVRADFQISACVCVCGTCVCSFPLASPHFRLPSLLSPLASLHPPSPPWDPPLQSLMDQFDSGDVMRMERKRGVGERADSGIRDHDAPWGHMDETVGKHEAMHTDVKGWFYTTYHKSLHLSSPHTTPRLWRVAEPRRRMTWARSKITKGVGPQMAHPLLITVQGRVRPVGSEVPWRATTTAPVHRVGYACYFRLGFLV